MFFLIKKPTVLFSVSENLKITKQGALVYIQDSDFIISDHRYITYII